MNKHRWHHKSKHQQICGNCGQVRRWDGSRWLFRKQGQLVRQRPTCGEKRTDTDRYAELRALVEAWQTARSASERNRASIPPAVSTLTANPTGQPEGWLARFMDTCAAETLLADWSHR